SGAAAEAFERLAQEAGRKTRAAVPNVELDRVVHIARVETYVAVAVAERVLDQVRKRLLEPHAVGRELPVLRVDVDATTGGAGALREAHGEAFEHVEHVHRLGVDPERAAVEAREQQRVLRELR